MEWEKDLLIVSFRPMLVPVEQKLSEDNGVCLQQPNLNSNIKYNVHVAVRQRSRSIGQKLQ